MSTFLRSRQQGQASCRRRTAWLLKRLVLPALLVLAQAHAGAAALLDRITLLVPDNYAAAAWQVKVWQDTAADEGIRMDLITDSQLLALGSTAAAKVAGLVVPDSAHLLASPAVIAAIKQYAYFGGKLMLVYDAGVLDENGAYPLTGNSRFADLVGVDYVFWNNGLGAATMVGFGPVVGTKSRMDALYLPPGKYVPYVTPVSLATPTTSTAFVPTTLTDPSGTQRMADMVAQRAKGIEDGSRSVRSRRPSPLRQILGLGNEASGQLRFGSRVPSATPAVDRHVFDRILRGRGDLVAVVNSNSSAYTELPPTNVLPGDNALQAISGYAYGPIGYFSFVTTGEFPGTVYLSSPEHGLVAGKRTYGSGEVLFVNIPLGYFKAIGTDSAPIHGFLGHFARDQVGVATMSVQPKAKGGLIYNWHIDDGDDLNQNTRDLLNGTSVFKRGPFSIHLTAGPDVIEFGDGAGMNLNNDLGSRDKLRRLSNTLPYGLIGRLPAHAIGSHGGWIHDYWGKFAKDPNTPNLTYLLQQNFDAIERVTGRRIREYSSPVGNTPKWAIQWLENRGVVAMYLVADLGTGILRSYRDGARLAGKLWTTPVTPLGKYATFEEFDEFGIADAVSGQWLVDLQSFAVNKRTNRLFYNHPPGALGHLNPVNTLLTRGDTLGNANRFQWYTMTELADFSQRRIEATSTTTVSGGQLTFSITHPSSVVDFSWLLRKDRFAKPRVTFGFGAVTEDDTHWIMTATFGNQIKFVTTQD